MTLPASGAISFNNINVELGVAGTTQASLGQTSYRTLAGVASGAISMSNFYGKANQFAFTIASNQTNANLASLATAAGWNGSSKVVATINSGVTIYSTSTGTPALTISGSFPGGVELVNNGTILGAGGSGGQGGWCYSGYGSLPGNSGGLGMSVTTAVSITNNGRISGGGGGGSGGNGNSTSAKFTTWESGGGGGGGGIGNGAGASPGSRSKPSYGGTVYNYGQAGGSGTLTTAGSGGAGGTGPTAGAGGAGGSYASSGAVGARPYNCGANQPGGSGGGCLTGNSYITWLAFGTRNGGIS